MTKGSSPKQAKLVLFDHDGTLCHEDRFETESFIFAFHFASQRVNEPPNSSVDIEKIRAEVKGTTERNLVRHYCQIANIPYSKFESFESSFYFGRAKWYEAMKSGNEFIWSSYYPDTYSLLNKLKANKQFMMSLVTGNPKVLLEPKVPKDILNFFTGKDGIRGSFGDEGDTREELINKAVNEAIKKWKGFKPVKDSYGFSENVFYIADSKHDFFAGLNSKVRTIWIPSRNRSECSDVADDLAIRYIVDFLKGRAIITNDLSSPEVYKILDLKQ